MNSILRYPLLVIIPWLAHLLAGEATAAPVRFTWDKTPSAGRYDVYQINPVTNKGEWFGWATGEDFTGEFTPGTHRIAVIASNVHGYGPPSDNVTFVVAESPPAFSWSMNDRGTITTRDGTTISISLEFSADLKIWHPLPFPTARFTRIKAVSP